MQPVLPLHRSTLAIRRIISGRSALRWIADTKVVDTKSGKLRGLIESSEYIDKYYSFRGIPYAKPPIGDLRFQDPQPVKGWTDVRSATEHGAPCAQFHVLSMRNVGTDDCLYLNVYTKSVDPQAKAPVIFFIHGGHFMHGNANDSFYGPEYLLRKEVVLVTFTYRLGVLGFLNLEAEVASGNQGLKDQVMALKWVHDNIESFGGDPGNVTVMGTSAGAASAHYLTLSPLTKGLVAKAICQSGSVFNPWASLRKDPKRYGFRICKLLGKKTSNPEEAVQFLRAIPTEKLVDAQRYLTPYAENIQGIMPFGPGIDDKSKNPFMPNDPIVVAEAGIPVPLLTGYTNREGIYFVRFIKHAVMKFNSRFEECIHPNALEYLQKSYRLEPKQLKKIYLGSGKFDEKRLEPIVDMLGEIYFVEGIYKTVAAQIKRSVKNAYMYQFTYDQHLSPMKVALKLDMTGASHADDEQYIFRPKSFEDIYSVKKVIGSDSYKLMERMTDMWVSFAKTGDPTPNKTDLIPVQWLPVGSDSIMRYLKLDNNLQMEIAQSFEDRYYFYQIWDRFTTPANLKEDL